jgi:hypothetical protein
MTGSGRYDLCEVGPYDYYDDVRFSRDADFVVVVHEGQKHYEVTTKSLRSSPSVVRALGAGSDSGGQPS